MNMVTPFFQSASIDRILGNQENLLILGVERTVDNRIRISLNKLMI